MNWHLSRRAGLCLAAPALALLTACGGGSSANSGATPPSGQTAQLSVLVTDAPSDSWADIGVIVRAVSLVPAGQGVSSAVLVYDGSASTTQTNLVQLDELAQLLANAAIPAGTYDRAIVKIDPAPADVTLAPALDASGNPQDAVPASQIVVNGVRDAHGWVTLPTVTLDGALVAQPGSAVAVNLDFDLSSPLTVVTNDLVSPAIYALNFTVRHKTQASLDRLVLHHNLGQVTATATTGTPNTFTLHTQHGADLTFDVDSANGTLFYNLDTGVSGPSTVLPADFQTGAAPLYAKASARLQNDGSLYAVRVWYSATESRLPVWTPEGHVTRVNPANDAFWVLDENGQPMKFLVDAGTQYFFKGGAAAIGSGQAFLANLARGFKVQVSVADATKVPPTAATVDIQRAVYGGIVDGASPAGFSLLKSLWGQTDVFGPIGYDAAFSWWNLAYPTQASTSVAGFAAQASATAGAQATPIVVAADATLAWNPGGAWDARNAIFLPRAISTLVQTVSTPYANGAAGITYTAFAADGTPIPGVTLNVLMATAAGSQPIVREYTRGGNSLTIRDLTPDQWAAALPQGARVRVFGIPDTQGNFQAYVVNIFD